MFCRFWKRESGYSLIEVMVSIIILTLAILPMVSMFDMGLKSASAGGAYDKARAVANLEMENAKSLPYETVRTNFPSEALTNNGVPGSTGSITSSSVTNAQDPQVPQGFSYTVTKQYLQQPSCQTTTCIPQNFSVSNSATDTKLLRITVNVSWNGNTYQVYGLVTG